MRPGSFKTAPVAPANVLRVHPLVAALALVPLLAPSPRAPARVESPPARAHHALAYDPVARRVQLAGGTWQAPGDLAGEARAEFLRLVHHWERLLLS